MPEEKQQDEQEYQSQGRVKDPGEMPMPDPYVQKGLWQRLKELVGKIVDKVVDVAGNLAHTFVFGRTEANSNFTRELEQWMKAKEMYDRETQKNSAEKNTGKGTDSRENRDTGFHARKYMREAGYDVKIARQGTGEPGKGMPDVYSVSYKDDQGKPATKIIDGDTLDAIQSEEELQEALQNAEYKRNPVKYLDRVKNYAIEETGDTVKLTPKDSKGSPIYASRDILGALTKNEIEAELQKAMERSNGPFDLKKELADKGIALEAPKQGGVALRNKDSLAHSQGDTGAGTGEPVYVGRDILGCKSCEELEKYLGSNDVPYRLEKLNHMIQSHPEGAPFDAMDWLEKGNKHNKDYNMEKSTLPHYRDKMRGSDGKGSPEVYRIMYTDLQTGQTNRKIIDADTLKSAASPRDLMDKLRASGDFIDARKELGQKWQWKEAGDKIALTPAGSGPGQYKPVYAGKDILESLTAEELESKLDEAEAWGRAEIDPLEELGKKYFIDIKGSQVELRAKYAVTGDDGHVQGYTAAGGPPVFADQKILAVSTNGEMQAYLANAKGEPEAGPRQGNTGKHNTGGEENQTIRAVNSVEDLGFTIEPAEINGTAESNFPPDLEQLIGSDVYGEPEDEAITWEEYMARYGGDEADTGFADPSAPTGTEGEDIEL